MFCGYAKGVFHSYVEPGKELDTAKMHRVAADKFILNITFAWEHAVAITEEEDAGTLVSHRFFMGILLYKAGYISREVFWEYARFKHPTHQISFHTIRALACLKYERCER